MRTLKLLSIQARPTTFYPSIVLKVYKNYKNKPKTFVLFIAVFIHFRLSSRFCCVFVYSFLLISATIFVSLSIFICVYHLAQQVKKRKKLPEQ